MLRKERGDLLTIWKFVAMNQVFPYYNVTVANSRSSYDMLPGGVQHEHRRGTLGSFTGC